MDIFTIEAMVAELAEKLPGALLNKVHQPAADTIILRLWTGRQDLRLLISIAPRAQRLHFTTRTFPNPFTPPRFCQLLRSRLSVLTKIEQVPGERIVRMHFRDSGGQLLTLIVELTGGQANLILIDAENKIIDSLRRMEGEGRPVLPGLAYHPPTPLSRRSLTDPLPEIPPDCASAPSFREWLLARFTPMSTLMAEELSARVAGGTSPAEVLATFREVWMNRAFQPMVASLGSREVLSPFLLVGLSTENPVYFPTLSEAAEYFYHDRGFLSGGTGDRELLATAVRRARQRLAVRREKISKEKEKLLEGDNARHRGELLLANLYKIRKGMGEVTVDDYYLDPPHPLTIELDPRLSPQENAERFFKEYKKGKRGVEHIDRRLRETLEEETWLDDVALAIEQSEGPGDLQPIRQELEEARILKGDNTPARQRRLTPGPEESVRQATSPGGYRLQWGKNNRANDYVSKRLTAADDLWFHAHGQPGCHLVLKKGEKAGPVPEADILFAAAIAAAFSRGGKDSKVEVMVTEGKWVRKPKGARPGLVVVERFRTVLVSPSGAG